MESIVITAAAMIINQALGLLGLWLRLRSQIRQKHAHRRLLVDVVRVLPRGGQVCERRADGVSLTLTVAPESGEQRGDSG